jgi:hypothetical protein
MNGFPHVRKQTLPLILYYYNYYYINKGIHKYTFMSTFRLSYFPTFPVNNLEVSKVFFIFANEITIVLHAET